MKVQLHTIHKAIVDPVVHKASIGVELLALAFTAGCLGLGYLILMVREDQIPAVPTQGLKVF